MLRPFAFLLTLCLVACRQPAQEAAGTPAIAFPEGRILVPLMDPAKLATLGDRGANPRIQKITAWLATGKQQGRDPGPQVDFALSAIGWESTGKARLTRAAILRNLAIAESLGCTDPEDIKAMKRGRAPIVETGPHAGEILSIDHIIPRAVAPELDNVLANLEFMPLRANQSKGDSIGHRQRNLARELAAAGLLSPEALNRILTP